MSHVPEIVCNLNDYHEKQLYSNHWSTISLDHYNWSLLLNNSVQLIWRDSDVYVAFINVSSRYYIYMYLSSSVLLYIMKAICMWSGIHVCSVTGHLFNTWDDMTDKITCHVTTSRDCRVTTWHLTWQLHMSRRLTWHVTWLSGENMTCHVTTWHVTWHVTWQRKCHVVTCLMTIRHVTCHVTCQVVTGQLRDMSRVTWQRDMSRDNMTCHVTKYHVTT